MLSRNSVLTEVLERTATMALPGWYLTAGCLFQTVWNVVTDRPPTAGIKDYDVFYFDTDDLSWEAEDAVIKAGREIFADLPAEVALRPNPVLAPRSVYEAKSARWREQWPELRVLEWPGRGSSMEGP